MTPSGAAGSLLAFVAPGRRAEPRAVLLTLFVVLGGCVPPVESGPPIADPAALVAHAMAREGADAPSLLRFDWHYSDLRGGLQGEGVARFNPPDSLRLDLFTSGEMAMAVAVAGMEIRSQGEIEDIELPSRPLLFAMAGLFRPGRDEAPRAYESGSDSVLVYGVGGDVTYFFLREGRLRRVEERRSGRRVQRVNLEWHGSGEWPAAAEYRDLNVPSRARWTMRETSVSETRYPSEIYDLPVAP